MRTGVMCPKGIICQLLNRYRYRRLTWYGHVMRMEEDHESDTGEKEERETKDNVEGCVQEGHADCRTERGR